MTRHLALCIVLSVLAVGIALASGGHRRPALIGAASASFAGLGSLLAMARFARGSKPVQASLAVMSVAFLVRIVLVSLGTAFVVRSGQSVIAFVLAFFVPFFAFVAIEGAYLHSLRRGTGPTA